MLILGVVMQLGGGQSALADSLERLTVMAAVSGSLQNATSMDCTVQKPGTGDESSQYRILWDTDGVARIDMDLANGSERTLWISNGAVSVATEGGTVRSMTISAVPPNWHLPLEFTNPTNLARNMEHYGAMQTGRQDIAGQEEFLLIGQEDQQTIEITIDAGTYLPKTVAKYLQNSARRMERIHLEKVWFQWNQTIPKELLIPGSSAVQ
jgi:hypothetical protein